MTLRIKEIMKTKGVKQARLANILGISPGYLSLLASNQREPSPGMLARIAEALDVDVPTLFSSGSTSDEGFREPSVQPVDMTKIEAERLCRALGVTAKHPSFYDVNVSAAAFAVAAGDRLAVDLNGTIENGDIVLATTVDPSTTTPHTGLYRWLDPWLEASEPFGRIVKYGGIEDIAILGRVCGIARAL